MKDIRQIRVRVNGAEHELAVETRRTLADMLRHDLGYTGTHLGCEHGICGACTVLVDSSPVRSCLVFGVQADGFGRRSRDANSDRRRQWHDMVNAELGKIRYPVAACRRGRVFTSLEAKRQTWMPNSHRYVLVRDHDVPPRSESQPDHKSQL